MNELTEVYLGSGSPVELIERKQELDAEIAQLDAEIAQLDAEISSLNAVIEQQREAWLEELIECTAESVYAQGHDKSEFLSKLAKALGVKLGTNRAAPKTRKAHVFPDGNIYRGGKPPAWLLEELRSKGLDPSEKGVVRAYCEANAEQRYM